jgi:hypothetical protein
MRVAIREMGVEPGHVFDRGLPFDPVNRFAFLNHGHHPREIAFAAKRAERQPRKRGRVCGEDDVCCKFKRGHGRFPFLTFDLASLERVAPAIIAAAGRSYGMRRVLNI